VPAKYRSKAEERVAATLPDSAKYEPVRLEYPGAVRSYYPDFVLKNGIAIEVKGWFKPSDRAKMLRVKKQYPGLDVRLVLDSPDQFTTKTKTMTNAEWCEKHGFPWAKRFVPARWLSEPNNNVSIAILAAAPKRNTKGAA
jgi:hypothetical protein